MSGLTVRNAFRNAWDALVPGLPLFETINADPNDGTLPDTWATVEFQTDGETRNALGVSCYRETGTITVAVLVRSGTGDDDAVTWIETIRDACRNWTDQDVKIETADPADEGGGIANGNWFVCETDLLYTFDYLK